MAEQQQKKKGVVDMVFLIDATGSMQGLIDGLKNNISTFIDFLTTKSGNNPSPVKDWRAKVAGFRDFEQDTKPFEDNPFVTDAAELKRQLTALVADGGGDDPESLLDALYKVATMGETAKESEPDPVRWRYRHSAARVIVAFTDAEFKPAMAIAEAKGGGVGDVANALMGNRILLSLFAPDRPCYSALAEIDKVEYLPVGQDVGLAKFTEDQANFQETLKQLAKSVSASADTPVL